MHRFVVLRCGLTIYIGSKAGVRPLLDPEFRILNSSFYLLASEITPPASPPRAQEVQTNAETRQYLDAKALKHHRRRKLRCQQPSSAPLSALSRTSYRIPGAAAPTSANPNPGHAHLVRRKKH